MNQDVDIATKLKINQKNSKVHFQDTFVDYIINCRKTNYIR